MTPTTPRPALGVTHHIVFEPVLKNPKDSGGARKQRGIANELCATTPDTDLFAPSMMISSIALSGFEPIKPRNSATISPAPPPRPNAKATMATRMMTRGADEIAA